MSFLGPVGAIVSAGASLFSAIAQSNNAAYQAQVASNNAIIANQRAVYAANAGMAAAERESLKAAGTLGAIKAAEAGNNVDVNTGSALDVQRSSKELGKLDTETTLNNALLQAYGYRVSATSDEAESRLLSAESGQDLTSGFFNAGGTLLEGASTLPSKWLGFGSGSFSSSGGGYSAGYFGSGGVVPGAS